ncbi:MAG TPA: 2-hydroxyacid dehydrogenase [Bacteroidales bacterium]|nr:2-hydroxyacid dehydrogenase [Bacteroidales bacterium]HPR57632.1 2-hydroxyacid dehydrogenase [Bacteroidales bacterium]
MARPKVLFIDTVHPLIGQELESMGFQCDYFENYLLPDYERIIHDYEGIIIRGKIRLDEKLLSKAQKLKFIARIGAGMENIDLEFAEKNGITCLNAPEGNRDAVGEHAVGMLLMLLNHLRRADQEVRRGVWIREGNRGVEIQGKTVGIIGYGNMGSAFAQRLAGFDATVLAYDKYKFGYSSRFVRESTLEELMELADILSLHVPLTDETIWMVDDDFISKFRKPIWLINTSRGKVVRTASLVSALKTGKILGAALDVLEYEKLSFEDIDRANLPEDFKYLIQSDQVVLSPHIAGWTYESNEKMAKVIIDKIRKLYH